jgi:N-acetylglucosamine kinase
VGPDQRVILAVDAGGSNTRCALAATDGTVLGFGSGGPGNHILSGWETARSSYATAIRLAAENAGEAGGGVAVAVVGSAGVGPHGEGREVIESLVAEFVPAAQRTLAIGDMVAALWGALADPVGVVVSAGTGSVCYGRNAAGVGYQVGGWGHIMGDEGSAYDIAVQALRAVARAADGRAEPTVLGERLMGALGATTPLELALRVYGDPLEREQIAALAVEVVGAARDADAAALRILRSAGEELGQAAVSALRALGLDKETTSVSYAGSVFAAGDPVREPFVDTIRAAAPRASIRVPILPPLGGVFRFGLRTLGVEDDHAALQTMQCQLAQRA